MDKNEDFVRKQLEELSTQLDSKAGAALEAAGKTMATMFRASYKGLVEAGFSQEQAFQLVKDQSMCFWSSIYAGFSRQK